MQSCCGEFEDHISNQEYAWERDRTATLKCLHKHVHKGTISSGLLEKANYKGMMVTAAEIDWVDEVSFHLAKYICTEVIYQQRSLDSSILQHISETI
jgi:hypothetical protein